MKVRKCFVTNSSSTNFILLINGFQELADFIQSEDYFKSLPFESEKWKRAVAKEISKRVESETYLDREDHNTVIKNSGRSLYDCVKESVIVEIKDPDVLAKITDLLCHLKLIELKKYCSENSKKIPYVPKMLSLIIDMDDDKLKFLEEVFDDCYVFESDIGLCESDLLKYGFDHFTSIKDSKTLLVAIGSY